ncbi:MAG: DUF3450 family protein [Verrucomicrobiae bacterium]|nr:DUF3450 family protein [Verrucomicrobiae bacterium]
MNRGCGRLPAVLILLGWHLAATAAESPLSAARDTLSQWVQTQQLISRTRTEWDSDREMLEQSRALFERELKAVREQAGRLSTNSSVADAERIQAEAELKALTQALDRARSLVAGLEAQVRELIPLIPPPLLETVQPILQRLPNDPAETRAGVTERLQTVVSLLNELDKFQGAVVVSNEKRPNAAGQPVAVDVLYLGLGQAFYASANGDVSGIGTPSAAGWTWKLDPQIAGKVQEALAMYRNQKPAAFVGLPVTVQ